MPVSPRLARAAKFAVIPAALAVSGLLVAQSSYSAFSARTDNPGNSWASGSVALTDDDNGVAMFDVTNLKPGDSGSKCLTVTSNGSLPSDVRLYAEAGEATKNLDQHLSLKITQAASCDAATKDTIFDGTLNEFHTSKTNFSTGAGSWATAGGEGEKRAYTVAYTLSDDTPNSAQGGTAKVNFVWEAQNQ